MTSILPSPCWLILMVSPRLLVRPSTLMRSWRNFSNAETSKILSDAGCDALMINCSSCQPHDPRIYILQHHQPGVPQTYLLGDLAGLLVARGLARGGLLLGREKRILAYCMERNLGKGARGTSAAKQGRAAAAVMAGGYVLCQ